jgi:hypothetical protein
VVLPLYQQVAPRRSGRTGFSRPVGCVGRKRRRINDLHDLRRLFDAGPPVLSPVCERLNGVANRRPQGFANPKVTVRRKHSRTCFLRSACSTHKGPLAGASASRSSLWRKFKIIEKKPDGPPKKTSLPANFSSPFLAVRMSTALSPIRPDGLSTRRLRSAQLSLVAPRAAAT